MTSAPTVASLTERSKERGEPAWLVDARAESFGSFAAVEAPKWRRTDLAGLDVPALALRASQTRAASPGPGPRLPGVVRVPLAQAAREHPDLVRAILTQPVATDDK